MEKRIAIYGNTAQSSRLGEIGSFLASLSGKKISASIETNFARYLADAGVGAANAFPKVDAPDSGTDFVVTLGGDGTLLQAAEWSSPLQLPLLGINTGHLGFLTAYTLNESHLVVPDILGGNILVEHRQMLKIEGEGIPAETHPYALNEISILKADTSSMINIHTSINDFFLTDYLADGLIISTPTGSTGYNLSVGGPIVQPTLTCMILNPIAPHTLTMRPLVVDANAKVTLHTTSRAQSYRISIDGRSFNMPCETTITISKSPHAALIARRKNLNFAATLRKKLLWGAK